jgi:hypothetical protein
MVIAEHYRNIAATKNPAKYHGIIACVNPKSGAEKTNKSLTKMIL